MPTIIVKKYEHINSALPNWDTPKGKYVKNKDHYDRLMKESGMVSYEKMKQQTEENSRRENQYVPSAKAKAILAAAKRCVGSDGQLRLSGNVIEGLKELKALKPKVPNYMKLPGGYTKKGGFSA